MRSRASSQKLRKLAFERDKGICAHCTADCEKTKRVYWAILDYDAQCWYAEVVLASDGQTFWEADHIQEVAANGSDSTRNIQTLCVVCHKGKTATFMRRKPVPRAEPLFQCAPGCADSDHTWAILHKLIASRIKFTLIDGKMIYTGPPELEERFKAVLVEPLKSHEWSFYEAVEILNQPDLECAYVV